MTREIEIVRIPVAPAEAHRLVQVMEEARLGYFAAPACEGLELLLSEAREELAAVVTWSSAQAHAVRQQTPAAGSFFQAVARVAAGKPEIKHYRPASSAE
jgi:quinol monooxygenase YgiN